MANYNKGGEIFIDLGGINVEITSTSNTNRATVSGIYSRLEKAFNLGKRIVVTNYISKYGNYPEQRGVPACVALYHPTTSTAFFIPFLCYSGVSIISVTNSDLVNVYKLYSYQSILPPETTTNSAKILEETEKGEESK